MDCAADTVTILSYATTHSSVAVVDKPDFQGRLRAGAAEVGKFGVIGVVAFATDLGIFNYLRFIWDDSPISHKPLTCRAISVTIATTLSYFGNRWWTWRDRARTSMSREYLGFFLINAVALIIGFLCLGFSNYVLNLHTPLADNTANIVSIVGGTGFRFWAYRKYVFRSIP
jgi:putative flippase GtrA